MSGGLPATGAALLLLAGGLVALSAGPPAARSRLSALPPGRTSLPWNHPGPRRTRWTEWPHWRGWAGRTGWTWRAAWARWRAGGRAPGVVAASGAAMVGVAWGGPVAALFAGAYAWLAVRVWAGRRAERAAEHGAALVEDLVTGLAADLRAGLAPGTALECGVRTVAAAEGRPHPGVAPHPEMPPPDAVRQPDPAPRPGVATQPDLDRNPVAPEPHLPAPAHRFAPVLAAAATGGDVPAALRGVDLPGGECALTRLAAAWEVADSTGAPLADVLDRLDVDLAALRRRRARRRAEIAAASTTVRMLAVLPLLGIGLGYTLGADPLDTLLHSAVGSASALLALGLQVAGLLWAERLASAHPRGNP